MFWKKARSRKKWMAVFLCATALTVTACGSDTKETGNTGTEVSSGDTSNAESESIMCRVTAVGDNTLTVMTMGNGNRGERPEGTMLKVTGTDSDDGYQASEIVISSTQGFGGRDRNGGAQQNQEENTEESNNTEA